MLVSSPTALCGLILASCFVLPFGTYRGCGNAPPVTVSPLDRQVDAWKQGELTGFLYWISPHLLGLCIGVGTLGVAIIGGRFAFRGLWVLYALLIVTTSVVLLVADLYAWTPDIRPTQWWAEHGLFLLTAFFGLNLVLASWTEVASDFVSAMLLQFVLAILIGCGIFMWLVFLERPLIGGVLTITSTLALPLCTLLQLYGDSAAVRGSWRRPAAKTQLPQFTLRKLFMAITCLACLLAIGQLWGFANILICIYAISVWPVAVRRLARWRTNRHSNAPGNPGTNRGSLTCWYLAAALLLTVGSIGAIVCQFAQGQT